MSTLRERVQQRAREREEVMNQLALYKRRANILMESHMRMVNEAENLNRKLKEQEKAILLGERSVRDYQQRFQAMYEEKKTLEKMHNEKVAEVEKLNQTVKEQQQKTILVGDVASRSLSDYQQKFHAMNEENKTLEKMHREKVAEAEKLNQRVRELEEAVIVGDDAERSVRDYQQKFQEMNEENKTLEKWHSEKVAEVEKLTQKNRELEKAVLAGDAHAANTLQDYQQKFQEMNEERKNLDEELAHAKFIANRVASSVIANEWKDGNDKLMPVKQWLEERRFIQGETQQLRDKLAITDRAAKSQAQLNEKLQQKIQELEETPRGTCTMEMLAEKVETLTNVMEVQGKNMIKEVAAMRMEKDKKIVNRKGRCVTYGSIIAKPLCQSEVRET